MKNKLLFALFCVLIILSTLLCCGKNKYRRLENEIKKFDEELALQRTYVKSLIRNQSHLFKNSLVQLDDRLKVMTEQQDSVLLKSLITNRTIIYRYFNEACSSCIKQVIDFLNQQKMQGVDILIISNKYEVDKVQFMKDFYSMKHELFFINELGLPIEDYYTPYLFSVTADLSTEIVFVPERFIPELTSEYLNTFTDIFLDY